jgi:hypothetical protein
VENENPKNLYEQVANNVHDQIKGTERGILYKTIQIIVCEKQSPSQEQTRKICDYFGIKSNSDKDEDKKIIDNLLDAMIIDDPIRFKKPAKFFVNKLGGVMEWIFVAAAFTFVGLFYYKQNLDKNPLEKRTPNKAVEGTKEQPSSSLPIPADLCLVVPASIASKFRNSSNLSVNELTHLIDNASYFLCTTVKVADSNEQNLEIMTNEDIPPDSTREVYIRININDGRNLIDKNIARYLKKDLPPQAQCKLKKLACLKNLSGLENFNRI